MTDTPIEPTDFAATSDDEELVFDDVPAVSKKSRRAPAKGRDTAELSPSVAPDTAATEEPADPPAPVPQPGEASAGSDQPVAAPRDRRQMLLLAVVGLALFTSLMSLGGLIAVSRTLAAAQAQRDEAQRDRDTLARLPATIAALDQASARLAAATARTGPAAPMTMPAAGATPLSAEDFHHGLDTLRLALDNRQPAGANAISGTLHSGFSEIGTRLDRIEARLARPAPARPGAPR